MREPAAWLATISRTAGAAATNAASGCSNMDRGVGTESTSGNGRGEVSRSDEGTGSGDDGTGGVSNEDGHSRPEGNSSDAEENTSGPPPA